MARRSRRADVVRRLVSPIRNRVRRPVPRLRRTFPRIPPRWSLARFRARPMERPPVQEPSR